MDKLILKRRYFPHGTFSTLHHKNGKQICCMVERAWQNNKPNVSCVPLGTYHLLPHRSHKFGDCYALEAPTLGVTRYGPSVRTHCLIHKANRPSQLQGCLAPGKQFGVSQSEWGVVDSTSAFNELMTLLGGKEWELEIIKV
ncbi:DUF5675 family protein [Photobacterium sanguinicancri]|uniref:DUF5675 family protein n=1 Tax=Photobacterium sanguinicancri TaxID=875932 RepID=UPI0026E4322A|nr:DUF5675 family protein [Photobacterium sanguinicancri]MDO6497345.1 DUF5675 family protein [Photobacterium sanguinicancri]